MSIEIQARTQWGGGLDFPHLLCSPVVFSQLYLDLSPELSRATRLASAKQSLPGRVNPAENCGESHYLCRELAIALQRTERSATLEVIQKRRRLKIVYTANIMSAKNTTFRGVIFPMYLHWPSGM